MTKSVYDIPGILIVTVIVESKFGVSNEKGTSTSTNLKNVYSHNVKPNINRMFKGAILNAISEHIYKYTRERPYTYYDYMNYIKDNFKRYQLIDYDIIYFGVKTKRIKKNHKYYLEVRDVKTNKKIKTLKWTNKQVKISKDEESDEQEFLEENE